MGRIVEEQRGPVQRSESPLGRDSRACVEPNGMAPTDAGRDERPLCGGINTISIRTTRPIELAEFYRRGFRLPAPIRYGNHLGVHLGAIYLAFEHIAAPAMDGPGALTLWFDVEDVDAAFERLVSIGAAIEQPPATATWGDRLAIVLDPDDNLVGLLRRAGAG